MRWRRASLRAHRLLDLGFGEKLVAILETLDERRRPEVACQRLLLSATLPDRVLGLADKALRSPVFIGFGEEEPEADGVDSVPRVATWEPASGADDGDVDEEGATSPPSVSSSLRALLDVSRSGEGSAPLSAPSRLEQHFVVIPAKLRLVLLVALLRAVLRHVAVQPVKVLVFVSTGLQVDFVTQLLSADAAASTAAGAGQRGPGPVPADLVFGLHGAMARAVRMDVWRSFRGAEGGVLVATDVAARGLNLSGLTQIVQYDLPTDAEEYLHRVGRTARVGQAGTALLFLLPSETGFLDILRARGLQLQEVRFESIQATLASAGRIGGPSSARAHIFQAEVTLQKRLEHLVTSDRTLHTLASRAFQAFISAYAAHPKATRAVLRLKDIHLGHLAKSFGLREEPSAVTKANSRSFQKKRGRTKGVVAGRRTLAHR